MGGMLYMLYTFASLGLEKNVFPKAHLSITDIAVDSHEKPSIKIKVDPFRQGVTIYLGATGSTLCSVL